MPLTRSSFIFYKLPFFRRDYADRYTYPHTLRFSDTLCLKNALHTFFLKLPFFCSLHLLLTPETLPNHLFRKLATKNGQKTSRKEENFFFFFFNFFHIFPLPLRKKTKPLTFFPLFITGNRKTASENVFLFFFLTFFHPTAPRNRKNYHLLFFSKFRLKMP